jgi:Flp pilus assembly protein TadD
LLHASCSKHQWPVVKYASNDSKLQSALAASYLQLCSFLLAPEKYRNAQQFSLAFQVVS